MLKLKGTCLLAIELGLLCEHSTPQLQSQFVILFCKNAGEGTQQRGHVVLECVLGWRRLKCGATVTCEMHVRNAARQLEQFRATSAEHRRHLLSETLLSLPIPYV